MLPSSQFSQSQSQKLPDTCPVNENIEYTPTWQSHTDIKPTPWGLLYPLNAALSVVELTKNSYVVGRASKNDLILGKEIDNAVLSTISKEHFQLTREVLSPKENQEENVPFLTDSSFNGTYINGVKVGKGNKVMLASNDEISVAYSSFKMFIYISSSANTEIMDYPGTLRAKYVMSRKLGSGAWGEVKLVFQKLTGMPYAMKIIQKKKFEKDHRLHFTNLTKIEREVAILKALNHPYIIKFEDVIYSPESVFIVTEYVEGGELLERIQKRSMNEAEVKSLFFQLTLAVRYLHSKGIIHRDIKPENILLTSDAPVPVIKLSDFGLSKVLDSECVMMTMCGTPMYIAPEILRSDGRNGSYGQEADIWSMGVVLYLCLSGLTPFSSSDPQMTLSQQIMKGKYGFPKSHWKNISQKAKIMVRRLMVVDVGTRIRIEEVLNHPWLQDREMKAGLPRLQQRNHWVAAAAARRRHSQIDGNSDSHESEEGQPLKRAKLNEG